MRKALTTKPKLLKLLPPSVEKIAEGSQKIFIKKNALALGVYEVANKVSHTSSGVKVEITLVEKSENFFKVNNTVETIMGQSNIYSLNHSYKDLGFDSVEEAKAFFSILLDKENIVFIHRLKVVA